MQILKERRPMMLQIFQDLRLPAHLHRRNWNDISLRIPQNPLRGLRRSNRPKRKQLLRKIEPDPPIALANRIEPDPHHLARRNQSIEIGRFITVQTGRQNFRLENRCRQRSALQVLDHIQKSIQPAPRLNHALPPREQPRQCPLLDRLNLLAQSGQRPSPNRPQHLVVAPLAVNSSGSKTTLHHSATLHQALQNGLDALHRQIKP